MAKDGNKSFQAGGFTAGIQENAAEITIGLQGIAALPLTRVTRNVSFGRRDGLSSRYGITPIPGHASNERHSTGALIDDAAVTTEYGGLRFTENTITGTPSVVYRDKYDRRNAVLGITRFFLDLDPSTTTLFEVPKTGLQKVPYWITTRLNNFSSFAAGARRYDFCAAVDSKLTNAPERPNMLRPASRLEAAMNAAGGCLVVHAAAGYNVFETRQTSGLNLALTQSNVGALIDFKMLKNAPTTTWFMRSAEVKKNLISRNSTFLFTNTANSSWAVGGGGNVTVTYGANSNLKFYGYPPLWATKEIRNSNKNLRLTYAARNMRSTSVWDFAVSFLNLPLPTVDDAAQLRVYVLDKGNMLSEQVLSPPSVIPATGVVSYSGKYDFQITGDIDLQVAAQGDFFFYLIDGRPGCALNVTRLGRISNPQNTDALPVPAGGGADGIQYIDPCSNEFKPRDVTTISYTGVGVSETYIEDAKQKKTAWLVMPHESLTLPQFNTPQNNFEKATDAIFARDTYYELSYSIYNDMTGKESNVGTLGRINAPETAASDVLPYFFKAAASLLYSASSGTDFPVENTVDFPAQWKAHANHLQFIFYYREYGAFEWIAAGRYDAVKFFYNFATSSISAPTIGTIGLNQAFGTTGGQPGAFNDYSDLENDAYIDVCTFQGRVFWCSKTTARFSMKSDVLSYPLRNSLSVETGELRGFLPHFFQGQAEQNGRLLLFASDGYFEGRFTGNLQTQAVQVSLTADPVIVPVDGSDFVISRRSSEVAYSSRTACVAEGVVYFMGPQGIYRDDGVQVPQRISQAIEPFYFDLLDPEKTGEFFAHYNARTREILFYFRPVANTAFNTSSALTMAWVYALRTESWQQGQPGAFTLYEYASLIDWAQDFDTTGFQTPAKVAGMRTVIGARENAAATVSRAFYHDESCSGGDMGPGKEVMAKSIDTGVTAGSTRLYYAVGFSAAAHAAVVAGVTKVGITESVSYGQAVTGDAPTQFSATNNLDGLHLVTAKGVTGFGSYVEIATPASFVLSGSFETLTVINQFPLYLQGVHDVTAVIDTNYLAPEGLEGFHQFRKIHALLEPVALQGGTQEPRVTLSWCAPHEFPTTADSKSFPITPLNTRERTTQVVVDLYNNQMSSQGQGLRLKLTYPQIFGRFTLYWFSVDYNDIGNDNLMMYQRANS